MLVGACTILTLDQCKKAMNELTRPFKNIKFMPARDVDNWNIGELAAHSLFMQQNFGFSIKSGENSCFFGDTIEIVRQRGYGGRGHVGILNYILSINGI